MSISPDAFLNDLLGFLKTSALKAAIELDLFSAIAAEAGDLNRIARRTGASERGVRILCDFLTVHGFLDKPEERWRLTPSTEVFLTRASPAYMGSVADFLASPEMLGLWLTDPAGFVRKGGSLGLISEAPDSPIWIKFARAMAPFVAPAAERIAAEVAALPRPPGRVLDIAAGHGLFGIRLAQALPAGEVTALDWPAVLAVALENAAAAGVSARYRTLPGSAFELAWGEGYDLVLLTNFLHHFSKEDCVGLLARTRRALRPGGRALALDFVPNEDRVSPPFPAMFAYMMLGQTPQGDAYTAREFEEMGAGAGFAGVTMQAAEPTPQTMIWFET